MVWHKGSTRVPPKFHHLRGLRGGPGWSFEVRSTRVLPKFHKFHQVLRGGPWSCTRVSPGLHSRGLRGGPGWFEVPRGGFHQGSSRVPARASSGWSEVRFHKVRGLWDGGRALRFAQSSVSKAIGAGKLRAEDRFAHGRNTKQTETNCFQHTCTVLSLAHLLRQRSPKC